jgi:CspA family cold shock protein
MAREKGVVKWFSTDKGYGFIRRESGDEIFVHHTDIEVDGYAALKNGETVEFDVFESDRGPKARNLVPLDADGTRPAPRAKAAEGRSKEGRGTSRKRRGGSGRETRERQPSTRPEPDLKPVSAEGKKPLAQLLRDRLGKRFPGFGG